MRRITALFVLAALSACGGGESYSDGFKISTDAPAAPGVMDCTTEGQQARAASIGQGDEARTASAAKVIAEDCRHAALNHSFSDRK